MKTFWLAVLLVAAVAAVTASVLSAANPPRTGQPNQSCQAEEVTGPPGLTSTTNGFATTAVNVYAGTQPPNSKNPKSVSQYDVGCFQYTASHP